MLRESDFPAVEEIRECLLGLPAQVEPEMRESDWDEPSIDVRLQVWEDGSWTVHTGDSCFDQDHRGFWGSASVGADDTPVDLMATAANLREQAIDDCAMAGELEDEA